VKAWGVSFEGIVLLLIGAVVAVAGLIMLAAPETYQSVARIKVPPPIQVPLSASVGSFSNPYFIQTEFEVIQSEVVLGRVVEKLNLAEEWGRKQPGATNLTKVEAMKLLKRHMDLSVVRNTELIEIRVFSSVPAEAAKIANHVAETFQNYRCEQNQRSRVERDKANPEPSTYAGEIHDPLVDIVDCAVAARSPIRPNRPLCATVFLFGSLLMILGFYFVNQRDANCPT